MFNPVRSIIRNVTRKPSEPYRILTCPAHSPYETQLAKCNAEFWGFQDLNVLEWNFCRPIPKNYHLLERGKKDESIPKNIDFDFCLSHNTEAHHPYLHRYSKLFGIPLIQIYHTCAPCWNPGWQQYVQMSKHRYKADVNVFITTSNRDQWGFTESEGEVVYHAADTEHFYPLGTERKSFVLTVANMYRQRDYALGYRLYDPITQGLPRQHVGADEDPNFSVPIQDPIKLNEKFNECGVFLSTSIFSPIPCSVIEAALAGCPLVLASTCEVPIIFSHRKDALLFPPDRADLARKHIEWVLTHPDEAAKMGTAARETVLKFFNHDNFVSKWNEIFNRVSR